MAKPKELVGAAIISAAWEIFPLNPLRRKIRFVVYIYAVVFLLFLIVKPVSGFTEELPQPKIGEAAPAFSLETLQGEKLALEDLRGKYVVIHFATSW